MRLIYLDYYPVIEKGMSDSQVGARKDKNIRNLIILIKESELRAHSLRESRFLLVISIRESYIVSIRKFRISSTNHKGNSNSEYFGKEIIFP